jgi:hypothetical protein
MTKQFTIKQIGIDYDIVPECEKCQELLSNANGLHYIPQMQELAAANLERHLNSRHTHQYVADTKKIMDGGYFSSEQT